MAQSDGSGISARLWKLPGQLLLALLNATAILVIVAAIITLLAISRIDSFAENIAASMTGAVLSKLDLPQKDVLGNIKSLTAELRTLGTNLREIRTGEHPALQPELGRLKEAVALLNANVERLTSARAALSDEAIGRLGRSAGDVLTKWRDCSSGARVAEQLTRANDAREAGGATRQGERP
jgi:hypothetical protein